MSTESNEVNILAVLIAEPDLAAKVFSRVPVEQFDPPMGFVARAIQGLRASRQPVGRDTVVEELRKRGQLNMVGGIAYIHWMADHYVSSDTLDYHLDAVVENRGHRRLWKVGQQISQAAGLDRSVADVAQFALAEIQAVVDSANHGEDSSAETLRELLTNEDETPAEWVIPGLLERMERLILTGPEGVGKSTAFRQLAVCAASGIHPFTGQPCTPQRVLYIDVENSRRQVRRKMRGLALAANSAGADPGDNLLIECRPQGIDLLQPEDADWFVGQVAAAQPAALFTGPIYKLFVGDENESVPARIVTSVLDRARAAADCAVVLEAHPGHGKDGNKRNIRPIGSSLWLRWPEFGYGLRPDEGFTPENRTCDFLSWRGDRDEREWPKRLRAGGTWPWSTASTFDQPWTPTVHQGGGAS